VLAADQAALELSRPARLVCTAPDFPARQAAVDSPRSKPVCLLVRATPVQQACLPGTAAEAEARAQREAQPPPLAEVRAGLAKHQRSLPAHTLAVAAVGLRRVRISPLAALAVAAKEVLLAARQPEVQAAQTLAVVVVAVAQMHREETEALEWLLSSMTLAFR
jgi:hypothetical protein